MATISLTATKMQSASKKKFYQLANKQPTTGNPNIPPSVALAKEIREEINAKAGVTDANVSDLFDDGVAVDEYDDNVLGEVVDDNQQGQMVLERLPSAASSSVTGATSSIVGSRAKTRQNQVASAIEATSSSTNTSFSAFLQQRPMTEEFEWKLRRLEMEEARAKREEELHELRRKESRQQEQMNNLFQLAMTGMMAYMGMKKSGSNDEGK
jgi:NADPH-dependent curcumin reductase CurA